MNEPAPTVPKVRTFPVTDRAIEHFILKSNEMTAVMHLPVEEQRKYNYHHMKRAIEQASHAVDMAFADEMIPVIMGGRWKPSPSFAWRMPDHAINRRELIVDAYPLFCMMR